MLGGRPFSKDEVVGNLPTEEGLAELGSPPGLGDLQKVLALNERIGREFSA